MDEPLHCEEGVGGDDGPREPPPYARFLTMLQYILEREYEFILAVEVPENRTAASLKRR